MTDIQANKSIWVKRKWTILFTALASIAFIALAVSSFQLFEQMQDSKKALTLFCGVLVSKDYARAYNLGSPEFRNAISEPDFVAQQELLVSHHGELKSVVFGPSEADHNQYGVSSTIDARFVFERDDVQFVFTMKKVGENWLVYGYKEK